MLVAQPSRQEELHLCSQCETRRASGRGAPGALCRCPDPGAGDGGGKSAGNSALEPSCANPLCGNAYPGTSLLPNPPPSFDTDWGISVFFFFLFFFFIHSVSYRQSSCLPRSSHSRGAAAPGQSAQPCSSLLRFHATLVGQVTLLGRKSDYQQLLTP